MRKGSTFLVLIIVPLALVLSANPSEIKAPVFKSSLLKSIQARIQWNTTFGGTEDDYAYSVIQTTDSGFALAGHTESYGAGDSDLWLIKISKDEDAAFMKPEPITTVTTYSKSPRSEIILGILSLFSLVVFRVKKRQY